jgi:tripartite-type tricarboxylate transporter receptor subunit TctC
VAIEETMKSSIVLRIIAGALLAVAALSCAAQNYPSRPIRLVIPFPPGGGADIAGRVIGQKLSERLGVQVVIDNRPGASTLIGTEIVSKATPDGYTLLMATSNHSINPSIFAKQTFDAIADFTPIALVNTSPLMWAVAPQSTIKNLPDLVAQAKANPGGVKYGTGGNGTQTHLVVEMFRLRAGVDLLQVPYKSVQTTGVVDVVSGQITFVSVSVPALLPFIKAGRLRGIAVTSAQRSSVVPDVPTVAEQGYPGYAVDYWLGLVGPATMPAAIVNRLNQETNAALKQGDVSDQFRIQGADAGGGTPAELRELIVREVKAWAEVVKAVGFQPQ